MSNVTFPKWSIFAFVGGILSFLGIFVGIFNMYLGYGGIIFDYTYSGIDLISAEELTFGKYLPLIIGILGLILAIVAMVAAAKKEAFPQGKIVVSVLAGLMLLLVLVFFILVSTASIANYDVIANWPGLELTVEQIKDLVSFYIPIEGYLIILGPILAVVGALKSFNEE